MSDIWAVGCLVYELAALRCVAFFAFPPINKLKCMSTYTYSNTCTHTHAHTHTYAGRRSMHRTSSLWHSKLTKEISRASQRGQSRLNEWGCSSQKICLWLSFCAGCCLVNPFIQSWLQIFRLSSIYDPENASPQGQCMKLQYVWCMCTSHMICTFVGGVCKLFIVA